jgi:molybdate transport system substrate-binding protein
MAEIRILSAGAAQAVVERIGAAFTRDSGVAVKGEFSAVGAIHERVMGGAAADVILLTGALIDDLVAAGRVAPGSRADLGKVGTGVAVRAGMAVPDVSSAIALRARLLAASTLVCPDPATATAGKVVMQVLERLGIAGELKARMQFFPNGYAAMKWLADSRGPWDTGITQITEIRANPGVTYAGPLPGELQAKTVYSAGVAAQAAEPGPARAFIERLTSPAARAALAEAGFEFDR